MIKRLRRKFIIVSMCAVGAVLFLVIIATNGANYLRLDRMSDQKLEMLAENNGRFPQLSGSHGKGEPDKLMWPGFSPESPYETRYFTVCINQEGIVLYSDTGYIAAIASDKAAELAREVLESGKTRGYKGNYKYLLVASGKDNLVIFLDCSRDLSSFRSFLRISVLASLTGLLAVFLLVSLFSGAAIRPVTESYEKQKQFITDANHELKTPVTIISANAEVIEMENGSSQWTDSIRNQVKRLTALTENLVALTRMDEQNGRLIMTDFSLSDAVAETAESFRPLAEARKIDFRLNIEGQITCRGNEESIRQLVSLLCDNGVKYTDEGGMIELALKKQGRRQALIMTNTVERIGEGSQNRLFERFYRADPSRNSGAGGSGIGLSLAKAIVEAHRGKITAVSEDGHSLKITVIL